MNWLQALAAADAAFLPDSEVPRRFADVTVTGIATAALQEAVRRYGRDFWTLAAAGRAPLFIGAAGSYKTYAAAVLAHQIRERARLDVAWCNAASEFTQLERRLFDAHSQQRLERLRSVPFLVLDDFSQLRQGTRQLDLLVEVGTTRFDACLPTLWTANLLLSKGDTTPLTDAVGVCLARRILDASAGFRVLCKGTR